MLAPGPTATAPGDSGLVCLCAIASTCGVTTDPGSLRRLVAAGEEVDVSTLLRMAKGLGLRARHVRGITADRLRRFPMPAIGLRQCGTFFVIARAWEREVLLHDPVKGTLEKASFEALSSHWSGDVILVTTTLQAAYSSEKFGLLWFVPSLVKYRKVILELFAVSVILQLFGLVMPLISQVVIDKVLVHQALQTLYVLVFGLVVSSIFEAVLSALRSYTLSHTTNRIDVELGITMFRHLLSLPIAYFQVRRVGDSVSRMRELENVRSFLTSNALTVVVDWMFAIIFFAVMFMYSSFLTLIVLLTVPVYAALSWIVTPILKARVVRKIQHGAENQSFVVESVGGIETVKSMAIEAILERRWERQLAAYVSASFQAANLANYANQFAIVTNKLLTAALLWLGAKEVMAGRMTVGELVAFNMLAMRVAQPVLRLAQLWQDFQQVRVSIDRLGDILDSRPEVGGKQFASGRGRVAGTIEFQNVSFRYHPEGQDILRDISMTIRPGEIVGIVGPSGSGKSTLAKLVQRLYVATKGRVLVDGLDVAFGDPSGLRRQIAIVLQEPTLFTGTVRENIALSDPSAEIGRVIEAAKLARAHEFIAKLPQGYETPLGERGVGLSGGERQRIAIARALLPRPAVLIFDEATSALDAETESLLQENMEAICGSKTVIIIAHRLSAVRIARRIVTLEDGQIVEEGNHRELLQRNGRYAALWQKQSEGRREAVPL